MTTTGNPMTESEKLADDNWGEVENALLAVCAGYTGEFADGFIIVKNPDGDAEGIALRGANPNLVIDCGWLLERIKDLRASSAQGVAREPTQEQIEAAANVMFSEYDGGGLVRVAAALRAAFAISQPTPVAEQETVLRRALATTLACLTDVASGKGGWAWEEVLDEGHAALAADNQPAVHDGKGNWIQAAGGGDTIREKRKGE